VCQKEHGNIAVTSEFFVPFIGEGVESVEARSLPVSTPSGSNGISVLEVKVLSGSLKNNDLDQSIHE
jgi:hypothetical protein